MSGRLKMSHVEVLKDHFFICVNLYNLLIIFVG